MSYVGAMDMKHLHCSWTNVSGPCLKLPVTVYCETMPLLIGGQNSPPVLNRSAPAERTDIGFAVGVKKSLLDVSGARDLAAAN